MRNNIEAVQGKLLDWFRSFKSCVVAFSGGLDSTVVAKAAALTLGEPFGKHCVAVMAESASSFRDEVDQARAVAAAIPIRFEVFQSNELDVEAYTVNDFRRCYHCKRIRFEALTRYAGEKRLDVVVDGSNADDLEDFRPGRQAVEELSVRSPLAELGIDKATVRQLARFWKLPNSERPAAPCLSTRLVYGLKITPDRLRRVEDAERFLHDLGFSPLRVRLHTDRLARIEVAASQLERIMSPEIRNTVVEKFKQLGFDFVSVDLEGFRSGSMNVSATKRTNESTT